jgi:hypothetical protein
MFPTASISDIQIYVTIIKDVVTCFAAGIAAYVGINGLRAWQVQLTGKTEYELARRMLRSVYAIRDTISFVRDREITVEEEEQAMKEMGIEFTEDHPFPDTPKYKDIVYQLRIRRLEETKSQLEADLLEAEVTWGEEFIELLRVFDNYVRKLHSTLILHTIRVYGLDIIKHEKTEEFEDVLYQNKKSEQDTFYLEMQNAIRDVENFLKPHLKSSKIGFPKLQR